MTIYSLLDSGVLTLLKELEYCIMILTFSSILIKRLKILWENSFPSESNFRVLISIEV
jgi:hypothetical protein